MYKINVNKCADCGYCDYVCPFNALVHDIPGKHWEIQPDKCQSCGQCYDACITRAIDVEPGTEKVVIIEITDACIGCSLCSRACPVGAITGEIKQKFNINNDLCIKCGYCATKCKKDAIKVVKKKI